MAVPGLSEMVTSTHRNRPKRVIDNVSKNNALFYKLKKKGKIKTKDGGRTLVHNLDFQENATFDYYDGWEEFNVATSEILSAAEYEWKQAAVTCSISGREKRMNSGKSQIIDLYKTRIKNAERTLVNKIAGSDGLYSDGTGYGGKQIGGLQLLVADSPGSGVVGGIDRGTWSFWRNIAKDATTDYGAAASSVNIVSYMNRIWLDITRVSTGDKPDLIVADNNYYRHYWEALQPQQRFTSSEMADAGFESLKFKSADVVFDGGIDGGATTNHMYVLTTDYMEFAIHEDANFEQLPKRESLTQDGEMVPLIFMGNLTSGCMMVQAVLKD